MMGSLSMIQTTTGKRPITHSFMKQLSKKLGGDWLLRNGHHSVWLNSYGKDTYEILLKKT